MTGKGLPALFYTTMMLFCVAAAAPNVVLLTVDTLRADHLGCYGYERATSPNIDALAVESLRFDDAFAEAPQTGPSMAAMLTSLPPRTTGAVRNAVPIPETVPTTAEIFAQHGYATAAVVSNWNLKRGLSGLQRGFDLYDDAFDGRGRIGYDPERPADEVTDQALAWLNTRDDTRPFFLWVHYMDPHEPYQDHDGFDVWPEKRHQLDKADRTRAKYDSEISFADHHVGRFLSALPENTAVLFTADHGESLHEHGYLGHTRRVYHPIIRIPLLIRAADVAPSVSDAPVRGIDIGPTLLGLAGLPPAPGMLGRDVLVAPPANERLRVFEAYDGGVPDGDGAEVRAELARRPPAWQGIEQGGWKLMINEDGDAGLYDLHVDPAEELNRAAAEPARTAALREALAAWERETPRSAAAAAELSGEDREALEALGYLE